MTATEEIVISGDGFIERRIVLSPEQDDIASVRQWAYGIDYKRGCALGFFLELPSLAWLFSAFGWLSAEPMRSRLPFIGGRAVRGLPFFQV